MIYLLIIVFFMSLTLTGSIRRYAVAKNIIDIPNHRSSHNVPTPRGGGVAFIITFLLAIPLVGDRSAVISPVCIALVGAGLSVAALGFIDDRWHIAARWRLLGHFVTSLFALYCLGGVPAILFGNFLLSPGMLLNILALLYLVWLLNLYNFMDGIDGIAGIEAMSVCLGGAFLYGLTGDALLMGLPLALAAAVAGFLWWNLPSARIFMGDAGSGFLGLILGILSIQAAMVHSQLFWCWLILLGVFIVDSTLTLLYRLLRGCKVYEAHRSHAYQKALCYFSGHIGVTFSVLLINMVWLFPLAVLVALGMVPGFSGLMMAYAPLVMLTVKLKAGRE